MSKIYLKLYITGGTPCSRRALSCIRELCANQIVGAYQLEIIDVMERPELAEQSKVLATPTVIREVPPPERRVVGDLSDPVRVMSGLGLMPESWPRITPENEQGGVDDESVDGPLG